MYHLDNSSGVDVMPELANKESASTKWFTSRTPTQVASHPGADWFNIVQAELLNVLTEANITPDKTKLNQISQAIRKVVSDNAPPSASTEVAGTVKLNNTVTSTSVTEAGTANAVKVAYDKAVKGDGGFTQNLNPTGWVRLPNGLILQWGTLPVTGATPITTGNCTVNFPVSFLSSVYFITCFRTVDNIDNFNNDFKVISGDRLGDHVFQAWNENNSKFRYTAMTMRGIASKWFAIGY